MHERAPRGGFRSPRIRRIILQDLRILTDSRVQDPSLQYTAPGQPVDELAVAEIKGAILAKLRLEIGKDASMATRYDWYKATALTLRDRVVHRWLTAEKESYDAGSK